MAQVQVLYESQKVGHGDGVVDRRELLQQPEHQLWLEKDIIKKVAKKGGLIQGERVEQGRCGVLVRENQPFFPFFFQNKFPK
jgi:hypothetical protein